MTFRKWPSIEKFSDVYFRANKLGIGKTTFRGKIKLHGTNAAIRIEDGAVYAQKRTSDVTIGDDNCGFASFVSKLIQNRSFFKDIIFFGEWAGNGIQSGDAITKLDSKKFFIFAAITDENELVVDPVILQNLFDLYFAESRNVKILPWHTDPIIINMLNQEEAQTFITKTTELVDQIGLEDPYVKATFGVSGSGEGLVFYALDKESYWDQWMFKVKSEAHVVNKSKARDHVVPEKPEGVDDFVKMFFTDNRFKQILTETGAADKHKVGDFIKAVMVDVFKESVNELVASELEWKAVTKYAMSQIKSWYFSKCEELV